MTFYEKLALLAAIAAILAIAVVGRPAAAPEHATPRFEGAIALWLVAVAGGLLGVGIVSSTLLRHVVQIAPLVLAAGIAAARPRWAACVAAPLLAYWLIVMMMIWLFLLDVARILTGTYSPAEVALSIVIGASAILGLAICYRRRGALPLLPATCAVAGFAFLQFGAMWLSTRPFAARW